MTPEDSAGEDVSEQEQEAFVSFLQDTLAEGHVLSLENKTGVLSYLTVSETQHVQIQAQAQFTQSELKLLRHILACYPDYCPYDLLYASFYGGKPTERNLTIARQRLREAIAGGVWDAEMQPIRNVLSRTRSKLKHFGLDICSLLEVGYLLVILHHPLKRPVHRSLKRPAARD